VLGEEALVAGVEATLALDLRAPRLRRGPGHVVRGRAVGEGAGALAGVVGRAQARTRPSAGAGRRRARHFDAGRARNGGQGVAARTGTRGP
jgi:hypothetical protein